MRHDKSNEIQYHFAGIIITNGLMMYKKNPGSQVNMIIKCYQKLPKDVNDKNSIKLYKQ